MSELPDWLKKLNDANEGKVRYPRATRDMLVREEASRLIKVAVEAFESLNYCEKCEGTGSVAVYSIMGAPDYVGHPCDDCAGVRAALLGEKVRP